MGRLGRAELEVDATSIAGAAELVQAEVGGPASALAGCFSAMLAGCFSALLACWLLPQCLPRALAPRLQHPNLTPLSWLPHSCALHPAAVGGAGGGAGRKASCAVLDFSSQTDEAVG